MKTLSVCVALVVIFCNILGTDAGCNATLSDLCTFTSPYTCASATAYLKCLDDVDDDCVTDAIRNNVNSSLETAGVDCAGCNTTESAKCKFTETDKAKMCTAFDTFSKCLTDAKCSSDGTKSAAEKTLETAGVKCLGVSITVSTFLVLITVISAIKNYFKLI